MKRGYLVMLSLALMVAACGSSGAPGVATVALAYDFHANQSLQYRIQQGTSGTLQAGPQSEQVNSQTAETEIQQVTAVQADGTATIDVAVTNVSGTANGQPLPTTTQLPHVQIQVTKDGRTTSTSAPACTGGTGAPAANGFQLFLPGSQVKPGDSWKKSFSVPFPLGSGTLSYSTTNHLDRYQTVNGVNTAVIESDVTLPLDVSLDLTKQQACLQQLGQSGGPTVPPGAQATIHYAGKVATHMTTWWDTKKQQVLKQSGTGTEDENTTAQGLVPNPPPTTASLKLTEQVTSSS